MSSRPLPTCFAHDGAADIHVGTGLVARQAALLDEVIAQLGEPEPILVVAEPRPEGPQPDIRNTIRQVAVLEAVTHHATDDER
jgi:hypothetical protein